MARYGPTASVIDPADTSGRKNAYITQLRDRALSEALQGVPAGAKVLDFGCGSGNLSKTLDALGFCVTGVDIARALLRYAHPAAFRQPSLFVQYDGHRLPFAAGVFQAITTYGVLNYLHEDTHLHSMLAEFLRVLAPGGVVAAIEQTRKHVRLQSISHAKQRPVSDFRHFFEMAGFQAQAIHSLRHGHFPLLYAVRYGLIPRGCFAALARFERRVVRRFEWPGDYRDTLFLFQKR